MVAAHMMDPTNLDVLGSLAQSLLRCGQHQEALQCAEAVLDQVPGHRGTRAGSPGSPWQGAPGSPWQGSPGYWSCDAGPEVQQGAHSQGGGSLQHLWLRAQSDAVHQVRCKYYRDVTRPTIADSRSLTAAPDSAVAANGVSKSTKTILNKLAPNDVFFFFHSKNFIDFLRREGPEALEKFMSDERRIKIKLGAACKTFFGPGSKLHKSKARDAFIQIYVNLDNLIFYFWQLVTQHNWCLRCRYLLKEFVCRRMKIELCWKMTEWRLTRSFWRISKLLWFP